ncbi:hydrolase, partial [Stenotrophomonas sp. 3diitr2024]
MKRLLLVLLLGILAVTAYTFCKSWSLPDFPDSPQYRDGKFRNALPRPAMGLRDGAEIWWTFLFNKPKGTVPANPIPVKPLDRATLDAAPDRSLFRLGHSTILLKLRGQYWLTDPVFSERASPVQWMGPARFHA